MNLTDFMPPRGTTKVVELTLRERKDIGKRELARCVLEHFDLGTKVAIKYHGYHYVLWHGTPHIFSLSRHRAGLVANASGSAALDLLCNYFDSVSLLRMVKLIKKNAADKYAVEKQKALEARARILDGTYSIKDL